MYLFHFDCRSAIAILGPPMHILTIGTLAKALLTCRYNEIGCYRKKANN